MLHVIGVAETDEFGNEPPDGGVLVVGVKYTLLAAPIDPVEEDFIPWVWCLYASGELDYSEELASSNDSTQVPVGELTAKSVLLTARDAAKQLEFSAGMIRQRAMNVETKTRGLDEATAKANVRTYDWVQLADEIAEFAEAVETYLWYQRWLCAYY